MTQETAKTTLGRRHAIVAGIAAAGIVADLTAGTARAAQPPAGLIQSPLLRALMAKLAALPRRRDFKTVPMILESPDQWDAAALKAVLTYSGGPKQGWDNTDLKGPWLNVMRNSMNAEVFSFRHPDFLCVSATHGTAQFALYDDHIWEKYQLGKIVGADGARNTYLTAAGGSRDPANIQDPDGAYSPRANAIGTLQARGAVFLACHNAAWELAERQVKAGVDPDHLGVDGVCAELTNHLIPGVVLTPGAVGTIVELARAGFAYTR